MPDCDLRQMFPVQCWIRNERGETVKSPNLLSAIHDAKPGHYALCTYLRTIQGNEINHGMVWDIAKTVRELIEGKDRQINLLSDEEIVNQFYDENGAYAFFKIFPVTKELEDKYVMFRTNMLGNLNYKLVGADVVPDEEDHPEDISIDVASSPLDPRRFPVQCWILDKSGAVIETKDLLSAMREAHRGYYALCDYNTTYPYEKRSTWGDVWRVAKDVRGLITSFVERNDLSDEELVRHFREDGIFSYWRVLPTSHELFMKYIHDVPNHAPFIRYNISCNCAV